MKVYMVKTGFLQVLYFKKKIMKKDNGIKIKNSELTHPVYLSRKVTKVTYAAFCRNIWDMSKSQLHFRDFNHVNEHLLKILYKSEEPITVSKRFVSQKEHAVVGAYMKSMNDYLL